MAFQSTYGYDPFNLFDPFFGPYYYDTGARPAQRRRRSPGEGEGEGEAGGGALGGGGEAGADGGAGRAPYTVGAAGWTRSIPVDFIEREKEYVVRADIPGVHKDEIHMEVREENVLRFGHNPRAERQKEDEEEPGVFHRAERVSTFRNRNLRMPDDCDLKSDAITAKYEDGVLTITIPKKEPGMRGPGRLVPVT